MAKLHPSFYPRPSTQVLYQKLEVPTLGGIPESAEL
jgi:hypothetical protein